MATTVGVIADTHGLLRPEALDALRGSDLILHIGDVGKQEILEELQQLAPVHTVRGNVDYGDWAEALPLTRSIKIEEANLYLIHIRGDLDRHPPPPDCHAILFGHSHKPLLEKQNRILYLNPGSAGPRRFTLPISVALLRIDGSKISAEHVYLNC